MVARELITAALAFPLGHVLGAQTVAWLSSAC